MERPYAVPFGKKKIESKQDEFEKEKEEEQAFNKETITIEDY